jgi:hypothetical protein
MRRSRRRATEPSRVGHRVIQHNGQSLKAQIYLEAFAFESDIPEPMRLSSGTSTLYREVAFSPMQDQEAALVIA